MEIKRVKSEEEEEEDRISDLPDYIIQHILSFLPSTEEAVRTGILSKRWKNQWTLVPVLIFDSDTSGMSSENFLQFIENTLIQHDCSKIIKFHLNLSFYLFNRDSEPEIAPIIGFATRKYVEDLDLSLRGLYLLPEFVFNNASLVKLRTLGCIFIPNGRVNWGFLKVLKIQRCRLTDEALEHVLSGSPSLESFELESCYSKFDKIVVASKSLKRLVLLHVGSISVLEISCPNLKELSLDGMDTDDPKLFAQAIERVLSRSLLLESMSIQSISCGGVGVGRRMLDQLVIASKSLKSLVLGSIRSDFDIEISCPNLEELSLLDYLNVNTAKLLNLSSSLCAVIDFHNSGELKSHKSLIQDILHQLQHASELFFGTWFIKVLSTIKVGDGFSPLLNSKILVLDSPHLKMHHLGIAHLLRISPMLEQLVIRVPSFNHKVNHKLGNNYWISNATVFDCLASHLKTIKISCYGFPEGDVIRQHLLNLVQFLLNNARVLEKMVVEVKDDGTDFPLEVSQELFSLPRCSQNVIIELIRK